MKQLWNEEITTQLLNSTPYDTLEELFFDNEVMYTSEQSKLILLNLGGRVCENPLIGRERSPWVRLVIVYVSLTSLGLESEAQKLFDELERVLGVSQERDECLKEIEWMRR